MEKREEKPPKDSWYWYFRGIADASIDISEDLPRFIQPVVRLLFVLTLLTFLVLSTPIIIFRRFYPKKKAGDAYWKARDEFETSWFEDSPEKALIRMRNLRDELKSQDMKLLHGKGVQIQPFGTFVWVEYCNIVDLLYHWETRLGNYQEASDLCDEFLKPYMIEKRRSRILLEDWFVKKARAIRALEGSLAAQEFLMPYVDNDREESQLREYFLELRDDAN